MNYHIQVKGLTKKFKNLTAVDHIDFRVAEGEIFGFLGPNGAGKTTTVKMLTTTLSINEGNAYVLGDSSYNAFVITPDGAISLIIDADGDGAGHTFIGPSGIAVDALGNVYVSSAQSPHKDHVFRIAPDGGITLVLDHSGDGAGHPLGMPYGLAVDVSGNLYVAGYHSNNAFKIELCDILLDYPLFARCLTGPEVVADPSCACPDDDADGDVDLFDFARFQRTFMGP